MGMKRRGGKELNKLRVLENGQGHIYIEEDEFVLLFCRNCSFNKEESKGGGPKCIFVKLLFDSPFF